MEASLPVKSENGALEKLPAFDLAGDNVVLEVSLFERWEFVTKYSFAISLDLKGSTQFSWCAR